MTCETWVASFAWLPTFTLDRGIVWLRPVMKTRRWNKGTSEFQFIYMTTHHCH